MKNICKLYTHKTKKHKNIKKSKNQKLKTFKNPNNKLNLKFQYQWGQNIVKGATKGIECQILS